MAGVAGRGALHRVVELSRSVASPRGRCPVQMLHCDIYGAQRRPTGV